MRWLRLVSLATPKSRRKLERIGPAALQGTRPCTFWQAVTPQRRAERVRLLETDTQTDMLLGRPRSAICVQRFDDSLNSAIHTTYRTWLRSSSMHEPRDPPLKVLFIKTF